MPHRHVVRLKTCLSELLGKNSATKHNTGSVGDAHFRCLCLPDEATGLKVILIPVSLCVSLSQHCCLDGAVFTVQMRNDLRTQFTSGCLVRSSANMSIWPWSYRPWVCWCHFIPLIHFRCRLPVCELGDSVVTTTTSLPRCVSVLVLIRSWTRGTRWLCGNPSILSTEIL